MVETDWGEHVEIISMSSLVPLTGGSPKFEGIHYGATISFFVVMSPNGHGARKHRHPYEEVYVILEGEIEVIADGEMRMISKGNVVVIPPNTWHEFKNRAETRALLVNIHPVPQMIQEDWVE